ncbi:MAG TPA: alpha/beta hydrolase [Trebonia sp.]|nr:alpha/beta hydrolase [Trebonia sp.]
MRRPGIDAELVAPLAEIKALLPPLTLEGLSEMQGLPSPPVEQVLEGRAIEHEELEVPGPDGAPDVKLSVYRPSAASAPGPCVYFIHGGGMIIGDRFTNIELPMDWVDLLGVTLVSVEYRLAPQHQGTALVDDCYAGLAWVGKHAGELGVDPGRIVVAGGSAGGGLAAGVTLMARDRGEPDVLGQLLICPMLDHRNVTVSSEQYDGDDALWSRTMNEFGWRCLLGDTPDDEVSVYASPALAGDLSGLPPAYIDAGSAEVFRDEDVAYATGIWAAGGQAELHIWAGGFHGFDLIYPAAQVSQAARAARNDWLARLLRR